MEDTPDEPDPEEEISENDDEVVEEYTDYDENEDDEVY